MCTVTFHETGADGGTETTVLQGSPATSTQQCAMDLPIGG